MEKLCRMLYKNGDLKDHIAFEIYLSQQSPLEIYQSQQSTIPSLYEAYWKGPFNEVLFYETDKRLDTLLKKLDDCVEKLGYQFFFQEYQN